MGMRMLLEDATAIICARIGLYNNYWIVTFPIHKTAYPERILSRYMSNENKTTPS